MENDKYGYAFNRTQKKIKDLENIIFQLSATLRKTNVELNYKTNEIVKLKEEIKYRVSVVSTKEDSITTLLNNNCVLEKQISDLEYQKKSIEESFKQFKHEMSLKENLSEKVNVLTQDLTKLQLEYSSLCEKYNDKCISFDSILNNNVNLKEKIEDYSKEIDMFKDIINTKEKEIKLVSNEINSIRNECVQIRQKLEKCSCKNDGESNKYKANTNTNTNTNTDIFCQGQGQGIKVIKRQNRSAR